MVVIFHQIQSKMIYKSAHYKIKLLKTKTKIFKTYIIYYLKKRA